MMIWDEAFHAWYLPRRQSFKILGCPAKLQALIGQNDSCGEEFFKQPDSCAVATAVLAI